MSVQYPPHYVEKVKGKQKYPWAVKQADRVIFVSPEESWAQMLAKILNDYVEFTMECPGETNTTGLLLEMGHPISD